MSDISKKWDQRYLSTPDILPEAAQVLQDFSHLLPNNGLGLDLACGLGGNALLMAKAGMSVKAWDCSSIAIEKLNHWAKLKQLPVQAEVRDVINMPPDAGSFDVVVVSYFLERSLAASLCAALRPNGLLFYQTFTRNKAANIGPNNPDYLLAENELLKLFGELHLIEHKEGSARNTKEGLRYEAQFVGQKLK